MGDLEDQMAAAALLKALKAMLREQGISYAELAERMGVSLPTVKRMLNKASLPLDRLLAVCRIAGLELGALMERVQRDLPRHTLLTEEQDRFLAERPEFLTYLMLLAEGGLSPAEIEARHGISRRTGEAYLRGLEGLGLLEREPGFRVKLLVEVPLGFGPGSLVLKRGQARFLEAITSKVLSGDAEDCFALMKPLYLDSEAYREMLGKLAAIVDRYARMSSEYQRRSMPAKAWNLALAAAPGAFWEGVELVELV